MSELEMSAASSIYQVLMNDPSKRAEVLLHLQRFLKNDNQKPDSPLKRLKQVPRCESPTTLQRRRLLEKKSEKKLSGSDSSLSDNVRVKNNVPTENLLKGIIAFVEVKRKNEDRSASIKAIMKLMGATIRDEFTKDVTHVIFKDGSFTTYQRARLLKVHFVSLLWLDAVKKNNCLVPEKNYPPFGTDLFDSDSCSKFCSQIQKDYDDLIRDETRRSLSAVLPEKRQKVNENSRKSLGLNSVNNSFHTASKTSSSSHTSESNYESVANNSNDGNILDYFVEESVPEVTSDDSDCGAVVSEFNSKHLKEKFLENSFNERNNVNVISDVNLTQLFNNEPRKIIKRIASNAPIPHLSSLSSMSSLRLSPSELTSNLRKKSKNTTEISNSDVTSMSLELTNDNSKENLPENGQRNDPNKEPICRRIDKETDDSSECEPIKIRSKSLNFKSKTNTRKIRDSLSKSEPRFGRRAKKYTIGSDEESLNTPKTKGNSGKVNNKITKETDNDSESEDDRKIRRKSLHIKSQQVRRITRSQSLIRIVPKTQRVTEGYNGSDSKEESDIEMNAIRNKSGTRRQSLSDLKSKLNKSLRRKTVTNFGFNADKETDSELDGTWESNDSDERATKCQSKLEPELARNLRKSLSKNNEINLDKGRKKIIWDDSETEEEAIQIKSKRRLLYNPNELKSNEELTRDDTERKERINNKKKSPNNNNEVFINPNLVLMKKSAKIDQNSPKSNPVKPKNNKRKAVNSDEDEQKDLIKNILNSNSQSTQKRKSSLDFECLSQNKKGKLLKKPGISCTKFHRNEYQKFENIVKKLGGFKVDLNVTDQTTHLIAGESLRTINMLKALVRGCWILKKDWLWKSMAKGRWLPEEDYEVTDFSPLVQKCRLERQAFGPLYSMDIFRKCGPIYISHKTDPKPQDLKELIVICQGEITNVARNAKIVIGEYVRYEGVVCVNELWILDSISRNKLKKFKNYLLKSPIF